MTSFFPSRLVFILGFATAQLQSCTTPFPSLSFPESDIGSGPELDSTTENDLGVDSSPEVIFSEIDVSDSNPDDADWEEDTDRKKDSGFDGGFEDTGESEIDSSDISAETVPPVEECPSFLEAREGLQFTSLSVFPVDLDTLFAPDILAYSLGHIEDYGIHRGVLS